MTKDAQIRARADAELKEEAEAILESLGLTPSAAINMFYRQIVHRRAIPFDVALPGTAPVPDEPTTRPAPRSRWSRPTGSRTLTYGDFPHLFYNAEPRAPLDLDDANTFGRFLTRGDPETVCRVVTLDEIAERLPGLPLQPETRLFWERVVRNES
ncbi:MAG: type II toxin-antitoxin system RelB/DinJ family antitoxin [Gemmatimonadota bacterium]|jgi:DNA-damage-inducible protein J